ncbi:MAG: hypothetical protein HFI31_05765 [Lachnospiraceae bacterium]|nr:hypothetical protein [Lachnospiraceae bacterium]MCI8994758.1 hypothetical protein [Lachnospiraceae bacterium]MCI9133681.1 hypothetical protein [Lachnospiraceae bacterium]
MEQKQLRHFAPVSGPSTREPATGKEGDFRVSLGFTPGWFHHRLGIDFSERWHRDPRYRYETMVGMKEHLHGLFPELENFQPQWNERGVETSCATLSGVYGACPISAVYGLPVQFQKAGWPGTREHYTKEQIRAWKPIVLWENAFVQELMEQMDIIEEEYGVIDGYLAYQGVLNNAFRLMGQEIFLELFEDPPFARFLFDHIYETMLGFIKLVQERQGKSGFSVKFLSVSNCVINMVSTDVYEEFLLPYDKKLAREFEVFGVHTCNWDITRHIDAFRQLEPLGYLDMGMMSDMEKVRQAFPHTRLAVLYHPNDIRDKPLGEVERDFEKICCQAAPVDLALVDIEKDTPDQRVREVVRLAQEVGRRWERGGRI